MSANDKNTNAQRPQISDKDKLKALRGKLDATILDKDLITNNKKRKKLKRWFDRCARKPFEKAKPGDLCHGFQGDSVLLLGKRDRIETNNIRCPFLIIKKDGSIEIQTTESTNYNIGSMSYYDFYKSYKAIFGKNTFLSFFEDAWDGFMSITQMPRQKISKSGGKATGIGGHAANIATRVFLPVIAPVLGAYEGAKALKDKLIPTEEELKKKATEIRNSYKFPLQETQDNDNLELKKAKNNHNRDAKSFNKWVDDVFKNNDGHQTPNIVKEQKNWYEENIIKHDLEEINKAQTQQTTQGQ